MAFELGRLQSFTKTRNCYGIRMQVKVLRVYDLKLNAIHDVPYMQRKGMVLQGLCVIISVCDTGCTTCETIYVFQ